MRRFKEILELLTEASEGDARKYMKKVLIELGLDKEFEEEYGEHWSEEAFNEIRSRFIHNGCDVYFTPGLARIAYGDLDMGTDDEDTTKLRLLGQLVRFITTAHKDEFSRNLEHITVVQDGPNKGQKVKSAPCTLDQLNTMFGKVQQQMTDAERDEFNKTLQTDNGYTIIELTDFETANKYQPYTDLKGGDSWCYLESEETFNSYRASGNRTYLALAPGFEKLKPGDKGYGRSMIGFDMGPVDANGHSNLEVCNNRYNHAPDLEHENNKTGDSKYNEIELSKILGFPVWEKCPGYTAEELEKRGIYTKAKLDSEINSIIDEFKNALSLSTIDEARNKLDELSNIAEQNFKLEIDYHADRENNTDVIANGNWRAVNFYCTALNSPTEYGNRFTAVYGIAYNITTKQIIVCSEVSISAKSIIATTLDSSQTTVLKTEILINDEPIEVKNVMRAEDRLNKPNADFYIVELLDGKYTLMDLNTGKRTIKETYDEITSWDCNPEKFTSYDDFPDVGSSLHAVTCYNNIPNSEKLKLAAVYTIKDNYTKSLNLDVVNDKEILDMFISNNKTFLLIRKRYGHAYDTVYDVDRDLSMLSDENGKVLLNNVHGVININNQLLCIVLVAYPETQYGDGKFKFVNPDTLTVINNTWFNDYDYYANNTNCIIIERIVDRTAWDKCTVLHNLLIKHSDDNYELGLNTWAVDRRSITKYCQLQYIEFELPDNTYITYDVATGKFINASYDDIEADKHNEKVLDKYGFND